MLVEACPRAPVAGNFCIATDGGELPSYSFLVEDPHFNLLILTAPVEDESKAYFLWHIEIIPRLTTPAGFELGSGMHVNPCVPEEAARFLREASG